MNPTFFLRVETDDGVFLRPWFAGTQRDPRRGDVVMQAGRRPYLYPDTPFDWSQIADLLVVPLGVIDQADAITYVHTINYDVNRLRGLECYQLKPIVVLVSVDVYFSAIPYASSLPDWHGVVIKDDYWRRGAPEAIPAYRRIASTGELWLSETPHVSERVEQTSWVAHLLECYRLELDPYYEIATRVRVTPHIPYGYKTLFTRSVDVERYRPKIDATAVVDSRLLPMETMIDRERMWGNTTIDVWPTKRHPTEHFRWPYAQQRLVDWTITLWPLVQNHYVILWIVDWLEPMSLWSEMKKIDVISATIESIRRVGRRCENQVE